MRGELNETTQEMVDDLGSAEKLQQDLKFIPTLCPNCGWDMDCAEDCFLLGCKHCNVFYKPQWDGLKKLGLAHLSGDSKTSLCLPFWRVQAHVEPFELTSFADLVKVANLTRPVRPEDQESKYGKITAYAPESLPPLHSPILCANERVDETDRKDRGTGQIRLREEN